MEEKKECEYLLSHRGLCNFGNSCYFNSSIQFLKPIFDNLLHCNIYCHDNLKNAIASYYKTYNDNNLLYKKYNFFAKLMDSRGGQQDSDEAIMFILDEINSQLNDIEKQIFSIGVKYKNLISCKKCKSFKICNDDIDQNDITLISKYFTNGSEKLSNKIVPFNVFLGDILIKEIADESMVMSFKKHQSICNCDDSHIIKQIVLTDMNKFLIIYVNRCNYGSSMKINNRLQIETQFKITTPQSLYDRCSGTNMTDIVHEYILCGIIIHSGCSIHFGHYYAYSKNIATDDWYCCNDSMCYKLENFDVNTIDIQSNCSALLYIKK